MDTRDLMLSARAAGGPNAIYNPVQVQKLLFLIDREAASLVGGRISIPSPTTTASSARLSASCWKGLQGKASSTSTTGGPTRATC